MHRATRFLVACLLVILVAPPPASEAANPFEDKLSVDLRNVPLRKAVDQVLAGSGQGYQIDGDVPDVPVSLNAKDLSRGSVLRVLLRVSNVPGLTFKSVDGAVRVFLGELEVDRAEPAERPLRPLPGPGAARKVTVDLKNVPLRSAIDRVFLGSGQQYAVGEEVPNTPVTLATKDTGLEHALLGLLEQVKAAGVTVGVDGQVYVIRGKQKPTGEDKEVALRYRNTKLRTALDRLFTDAGLKWKAEADVPDGPLTLDFPRPLPFRQALTLLLQMGSAQAPGLTYRREGDTWTVYVRKDLPR